MSFGSKIGLASHHELKELKEELTKERMLFKEEIYTFFQEQKSLQEKEFESLKAVFQQSIGHLELKVKEETDKLETHIDAIKSKVSEQLSEVKGQVERLETNMATVQEVAKVHWASTLIDYIDELLDEVEDQPFGDEIVHPLTYAFGEITNLFKYIYEETKLAGLHVGWRKTKQTIQVYLRKDDADNDKNQIGSIQYEGSNDFSKKPPTTISWRFYIKNMPKKMVRDLSIILPKEQADILLKKREDYIVFKFRADTPNGRIKIKKISRALRKSMLLID